jgi:hypothetical protein
MEWTTTGDNEVQGRSDKTLAIIYKSDLHHVGEQQLQMLDSSKSSPDFGMRLIIGAQLAARTYHPSAEDAKRAAEIIDAAYIPGKRLVTHWGDGKLIGADAIDPDDGHVVKSVMQVNRNKRLVCEHGAAAFDARIEELRAMGYEPSTEVKIFPGPMVMPGDTEPLPFLSQIMTLTSTNAIDPELTPA